MDFELKINSYQHLSAFRMAKTKILLSIITHSEFHECTNIYTLRICVISLCILDTENPLNSSYK